MHGAEHGLDVAVREIALDQERLRGGQKLLAGEGAADEIDEVGGRWEMLPRVSWWTWEPTRKVRRRRWDW